MLMASQIGGAIAPLVVVPIQIRYGWRASFYVFGVVGAIWAAVWYIWFRDSPAEKAGVGRAELAETASLLEAPTHGFPWRIAFASESVLAMMGTAFCYVYVYTFFQTWFHTFLVRGRGFSEAGLALSALPYAVAACANLAGGATSDALVRRLGPKWGRRSIGIAGLGSACLFTLAAMVAGQQLLTVILLSLVYGAITFQQAGVFGVCLDIGRKHAGAMVGLMNTSAQVGGLLSSIAYGYIVQRFDSYNAPFVPMAAVLCIGALLWFRIDASKELHTEALAPATGWLLDDEASEDARRGYSACTRLKNSMSSARRSRRRTRDGRDRCRSASRDSRWRVPASLDQALSWPSSRDEPLASKRFSRIRLSLELDLLSAVVCRPNQSRNPPRGAKPSQDPEVCPGAHDRRAGTLWPSGDSDKRRPGSVGVPKRCLSPRR